MTTSYPAVGVNGLTDSQWATMYGDQDGIVEDYHAGGVDSFRLTRSGDVATIAAGKVKINGYVLESSDPVPFTVPPVSSPVDYYLVASYDPALNVADGAGQADPAGPCRLEMLTTFPADPVKSYTTLWKITRTLGQTLAASTAVDVRQWRGPSLWLRQLPPGFPAGTGGFGPFPRGTNVWATPLDGNGQQLEHYVRVTNTAGDALIWRSLISESAVAFPSPSSLVARFASNPAQYYRYAGTMIKCRGTLKRSSGNLSTGSDVTLGTLPAGARPLFTERFVCEIGGTGNYAEVRVNSDGTQDGKVIMTDPPAPTTWIDLSPINFRAEA